MDNIIVIVIMSMVNLMVDETMEECGMMSSIKMRAAQSSRSSIVMGQHGATW